MILLLNLIAIFFIMHGIYQLVKYFIVLQNIRNNDIKKGIASEIPFHQFILLAPVLHEERNIESFLDSLAKQRYPKQYFSVYVITTEKEYEQLRSPNTIQILEKIKTKYVGTNLFHLHYPNIDGFKADQLQYAFSLIRKELGDDKLADTFCLTLDTDSEINDKKLSIINAQIEDGIDTYQQPSLYFKNIANLNSAFMRSFSFMQSFFSISYEVPMFTDRFVPFRLKYLVGPGVCIRGSLLSRLGGFPSVIEDVRLGRIISFQNLPTKLLSGFMMIETAKSLKIYFKQASVWFFGCGLFISDYMFARRMRQNGQSKSKIKDFVLISYGFFKTLANLIYHP